LEYVHSKGIVHRDIKPSNILIRGDEEVKLADFGIAKLGGMPRHTKTGMTIGTYQYMSPEQILGKELDARSDIYSLGITLFEMVAGEPPFGGDTEFEICRQHLETALPSIRRFDSRLPARLNIILHKASAKKPEERYQTASEFIQAIVQELPEYINKIPSPWSFLSTPKRKKRKGCLRSFFLLLIWLLIFLSGGYFYFYILDASEPIPIHKVKIQKKPHHLKSTFTKKKLPPKSPYIPRKKTIPKH